MTAHATTQPVTRDRVHRAASVVALVLFVVMFASQFLPGGEARARSPFAELLREPFGIVLAAPIFGVPLVVAAMTAFALLRRRSPGPVAYAFVAFAGGLLMLLCAFTLLLLYVEQKSWTRSTGYWLCVPWLPLSIALLVRAGLRRGWERWSTAIAAIVACALCGTFGVFVLDEHKGLEMFVWTFRIYTLCVGVLTVLSIWILLPRRRARS
jgi:hypothetical protein